MAAALVQIPLLSPTSLQSLQKFELVRFNESQLVKKNLLKRRKKKAKKEKRKISNKQTKRKIRRKKRL